MDDEGMGGPLMVWIIVLSVLVGFRAWFLPAFRDSVIPIFYSSFLCGASRAGQGL